MADFPAWIHPERLRESQGNRLAKNVETASLETIPFRIENLICQERFRWHSTDSSWQSKRRQLPPPSC
jgi:hypothetical protein